MGKKYIDIITLIYLYSILLSAMSAPWISIIPYLSPLYSFPYSFINTLHGSTQQLQILGNISVFMRARADTLFVVWHGCYF